LLEIGGDGGICLGDRIQVALIAHSFGVLPLHVSFFVRSRVDANALVGTDGPAFLIEYGNVVVVLRHQDACQNWGRRF